MDGAYRHRHTYKQISQRIEFTGEYIGGVKILVHLGGSVQSSVGGMFNILLPGFPVNSIVYFKAHQLSHAK